MTIETLARLAAAFRVGLVVKFVPFSEMLRWENEYSQDAFKITSIDEDFEFQNPKAAFEQVAVGLVVGSSAMSGAAHDHGFAGTMGRRPPTGETIAQAMHGTGGR
jgi:hypothetical protein